MSAYSVILFLFAVITDIEKLRPQAIHSFRSASQYRKIERNSNARRNKSLGKYNELYSLLVKFVLFIAVVLIKSFKVS